MKRHVFALFSVLCILVPWWAAAACPPGKAAELAIAQPEYLAAFADNAITVGVCVPEPSTARLQVTLSASDGVLLATIADRREPLKAGTNRLALKVPAADLLSVNLFEDVTLTATLGLPDGETLNDEVEATVLPESVAPALSAWSVLFASKPALVSTSHVSPIAFSVANPSGASMQAKIQLVFRNATGTNPVTMASQVSLVPGANTVTVSVPPTTAAQAKSRGATTVKASLKVNNVVKSKDTAPVDYDLQASASVNPASGTVPLSVTLSGTAIGGQPPYGFLWSFGDGGSSAQQTATHTYTVEGVYQPLLTVTDTLSGHVTTSSTVTATTPPLTATCSATPTSGLAPLPVSFTGSASGGTGAYSYDWNFGDGSAHAATANALHTYAAAGVYTAVLTVTSGSQTKTCSQVITVTGTSMTVTCTADVTSGVAPLKVTFAASATGGPSTYAYAWDFGDGATSTSQNPIHTYTAPGPYHAVVTVTSGGQTATCAKDIAVAQVLTGGCAADVTSGTAPVIVHFSAWAAGGIGSYVFSWVFGDGSTGDGNYVTHKYTQAGTYTVTLTITSGSQTLQCTKTITVS